jgi:hypothetical protein
MKVMNYHRIMRKSTKSLVPKRASLAHDVTSEAGAYLDVQGRLAGLRRTRSQTGRFQSKKWGPYKVRVYVHEFDVLEHKSTKVTRNLTGYVLDVGGHKVAKRGARHIGGGTILRLEDCPRSRDFKPMKIVDYRDLAQETLNKLAEEAGSTAVDYLAAVFAKLSAGTIPKIAKDVRPLAREETSTESTDPLAAARARGRRFALEQYESPDNLGLLEARAYAGRNERSINEQRQNGELYALLPPGKTRGFRYPKWQFDAPPERLKAVLRPFVDANANCWVIHSFMMRKRDALQGKSPADVILDDKADVKSVIDLAECDLTGEQGAL